MDPKTALQRAIDIVGSQTALAAAIHPDIKTGHIYHWLKSGSIPADHCPAIERATNGAVRCEDLRPAVDWAVLRNPQAEAATADAAQEG